LVVSATVALALGRPAPAAGVVRVDRIRHSSSEGATRVVIDVSRPAVFGVAPSADSLTLVVSIGDAALSLAVSDVVVGANGLRSVRPTVGAASVDLVFELERPAAWHVFALPREHGKPHRVVVDLRPRPVAGDPAVGAFRDSVSEPPAIATASPPPAAAPPATSPRRPFVVAVDAGHGGHDVGAAGRYGLVEKKLTLDLARRVAEILNRSGRARAVLTREADEYLTLPRRNEIAQQKGADVFVSIHLNTAPNRSARGAEIFFVAPAGAERAANQALESGEAAHEFGLDDGGSRDIVHMLLDVNQQAVLARSELLAESILEAVRESDLLPTRAVKQKSFSVLRTISMPSVLVEAGFISNPADAKMIRDPDGRERIARAVADGVLTFFRAHPPQRIDTSGAPASVVHRVQPGDTLWLLSRRYNTTVARLRELNGLAASEQIRVGQEILVPGAE
jgi:N-acetylmuramoyl-L-alanine amidase